MPGKMSVIIILSLSLVLGILAFGTMQQNAQGKDTDMVEQLLDILHCTQEQAEDIAQILKDSNIRRIDDMTLEKNERGYMFLTLKSGEDTYTVGLRKNFFVEEVRKKGTPKDSILYQIIY